MRRSITLPDDITAFIRKTAEAETRNFNQQLLHLLFEAKAARQMDDQAMDGMR